MPVIYRPQSVLDGMTKRIDKDTYLTPYELAYAAVGWLYDNTHYPYTAIQYVLDPGAGNGVWGKALRAHWRYRDGLSITGVELRKKVKPDGYDFWHPRQDYLKWTPTMMPPDLVIGNPPFLAAEEFIEESFSLLSPNGIICFLLPTDFMHTKGRSDGLFKEHPPRHVVSLAERPQFLDPKGKSLGKANTNNYVLGVWVNDSFNHTVWHSWSWK